MRGYFAIGVEDIGKEMNMGNLFRSAHAFGAPKRRARSARPGAVEDDRPVRMTAEATARPPS